MGTYAPVYMTDYDTDGPEVALGALALSASTFASNAAANTAIGNVTGVAGGSAAGKSTLILVSPTDGTIALVGAALKVGAVPTPSARTIPIILREVNQYAMWTTRDTKLNVTVT